MRAVTTRVVVLVVNNLEEDQATLETQLLVPDDDGKEVLRKLVTLGTILVDLAEPILFEDLVPRHPASR
eukprot:4884876-Prorocentrum_lima.AAC.1